MEGFNALNKTNNMVIFIYKYHINGKAHEKHVDRFTASNDKGLSFREGFSIKKAGHSGQKGVCSDSALSNDRIFGCIKNGKQS